MSSKSPHMQPESDSLPSELAEISRRLDALGQRDQASGRRGLEERLLAAAMRVREADTTIAERESIPFPVSRARPARSWRMAASLALSVGMLGGATWIASRTPTTLTGTASNVVAQGEAGDVAEELDQFLTSVASWDIGVSDSIESTREAIDLATSSRDFWGDSPSDAALLEETL